MSFIIEVIIPWLLTIVSVAVPVIIADTIYHKWYCRMKYYDWDDMWLITRICIVALVIMLVIALSASIGTGLGYLSDQWKQVLNIH